ncbi:MAG: hypothetical protein ACK551_00290 [Vampirovibrionales bacterium]
MVSFNPSTSLRSGSSLSDLSHFKALQKIAREEFGLQSVIFRDNLQTAHDVIAVLRDLKKRGYDLSGISINVSKQAWETRVRWILNLPDDASDELINQRFQLFKPILPPLFHNISNASEQKAKLDTISWGGFTHPTVKGKTQRPLIFIAPDYQRLPLDIFSTNEKLHIIYHEIGHALHFKVLEQNFSEEAVELKTKHTTKTEHIEVLSTKMLEQRKKIISNLYPNSLALLVIRIIIENTVGLFASQLLEEFVPEYFIKKLFNPIYTDETLDRLYNTLKGPEIRPRPSKP